MFSHLQYLEPAMAYVPYQKFTENFPLQYALNAGTIFPQLCKPFVEREVFEDENRLLPKTVLNHIDQVSFAVNDMTLYLDTHPCDEKALTYCHELVQERKKLLKEYAEAYGPLIIDITDQTGESIWKWMEQPFPWEKEGACR